MPVPSTQTLPTSQVPVLPSPPVAAPTVQVVAPAAPAPRPSVQGWPPGFQPSAPSRVAPSRAAPAAVAAPRVTGPAPLEIPSSVVGPDLVVKGGAGKKPVVTMEPEEAELQTGRAEPTPQGPMPVMVRRVPRPVEDDQDLPPTEAWSPQREAEPQPQPRRGQPPSAPLFDDSYKQTNSEILDQQQLPLPPDRSMDLIWWSLAIAGALVLVALLITFK
jgi:hypothetical protein